MPRQKDFSNAVLAIHEPASYLLVVLRIFMKDTSDDLVAYSASKYTAAKKNDTKSTLSFKMTDEVMLQNV